MGAGTRVAVTIVTKIMVAALTIGTAIAIISVMIVPIAVVTTVIGAICTIKSFRSLMSRLELKYRMMLWLNPKCWSL